MPRPLTAAKVQVCSEWTIRRSYAAATRRAGLLSRPQCFSASALASHSNKGGKKGRLLDSGHLESMSLLLDPHHLRPHRTRQHCSGPRASSGSCHHRLLASRAAADRTVGHVRGAGTRGVGGTNAPRRRVPFSRERSRFELASPRLLLGPAASTKKSKK